MCAFTHTFNSNLLMFSQLFSAFFKSYFKFGQKKYRSEEYLGHVADLGHGLNNTKRLHSPQYTGDTPQIYLTTLISGYAQCTSYRQVTQSFVLYMERHIYTE